MTNFNPYENRIPFFLLTNEEKEILKSNGPWEFLNSFKAWFPKLNPSWEESVIYRSTKVIIKPTVNWQYFSDSVKAVAWDKNGEGFAFDSVPIIDDIFDDEWLSGPEGNHGASISLFPSCATTRGNCDWTESIVIRGEI